MSKEKIVKGCPDELKDLWYAFDEELRLSGSGSTKEEAVATLERMRRIWRVMTQEVPHGD